MNLEDSRRLTGPNLQATRPGAVAEVSFGTEDIASLFVAAWRREMERISEHLPFKIGALRVRRYRKGAALYVEAPIDALYAATNANEWAIATADAELNDSESPSMEEALTVITETYAEEACPLLLELQLEAQQRAVPYLWDDDQFSIGYGRYSKTWRRNELPHIEDVPWSELGDIPVILITGTNGKTTTARLLAQIVKETGLTVGNSSTDGIAINGQLVESGDWTGPGAARAILRHPEVEVAILETARGGILRRGLGVERCDAAIVTNVAADHLGEYGVHDLTDMAVAKGLVYSIVRHDGYRVLNMDDENVSVLAGLHHSPEFWFSQNGREVVAPHMDAGGAALFVENGKIKLGKSSQIQDVIELDDIPMAMGGAAKHDISNALAAIALSISLHIELDPIRAVLATFGTRWTDNPGRGQRTSIGDVDVLMDFGHNPHGVEAVLSTAQKRLSGRGRMSVSIGQAGDRDDDAIRGLAAAAAEYAPDRIILRALPEQYHRGRQPGTVTELMHSALTDKGFDTDKIGYANSEVDALDQALKWARPGDLVVHLVHIERDAVKGRLTELGATL